MGKEQTSSQKEPGDMTHGRSIGKVGVTVNDTRPIIYVWRAISNVTPFTREKLKTINLQYATATSGWKHKTNLQLWGRGGWVRSIICEFCTCKFGYLLRSIFNSKMSLSLSLPVSVPISVSLSLDACALCIVWVCRVCVWGGWCTHPWVCVCMWRL